jgi:hypothetical protein
MDLESGAHRATGTTLENALKRYWEGHGRLRARTLEIYKAAAAKFQDWAKRSGIRTVDDVTAARLVAFRAELAREPRRQHTRGGKRGQQRTTKEARSPSTINVERRATRTILGYLRKLGLLPRIGTDDLKDGLERLAVSPRARPFPETARAAKALRGSATPRRRGIRGDPRRSRAGARPRRTTTRQYRAP